MKLSIKKFYRWIPSGIICLVTVFALFGYLAMRMGTANMLNTVMNTAHDLLLNTVFYLMAVCVITGALGRLFVEFGVVDLLEKILRPLMKPMFNLPGVASLGAVMTFLSDNPAIISLAQDKRFACYFKKYQFISLTNFGTAFGMGLLVIVFMVGQGFYAEPFTDCSARFADVWSLHASCSVLSSKTIRLIFRRTPAMTIPEKKSLWKVAGNRFSSVSSTHFLTADVPAWMWGWP